MGCISPVHLIQDTAIYEDTRGRVYRVRQELTAEANGKDLTALREGKTDTVEFDNSVPEEIIFFDYYIKKKKDVVDKKPSVTLSGRERASPKVKSDLLPGEKGTVPEPGEEILLQRLKQSSKDDPEKNYVPAQVLEVWAGDMTLEDEKYDTLATFNRNVGLVRVKVKDHFKYSGSLCLQPAVRQIRSKRPYGA